jgi:uncharacterized protein (TIGR03546 family)
MKMGHFLFSFFKELNSSSSKKMISLAFVLGLISGFLPLHNIFLWLILLFVFIFRVPLGLYFASYAVFAIFSYLLDPVFNKVGYFILTLGFLKPLWTFFYNLPLMRWSGFNNTLVMGSFVIGIVLAVPIYFYLNKTIEYYRNSVFPKLRKIKFLSWIVPKEEKKGIIRFSGIIFVVAVTGIISFFLLVLLDPIVKFALEFSLSKATHKKVVIQKVNVSLFNASVDIENMNIDKFLIKRAYLKFDGYYLLWRKYDIKSCVLEAKTNQSLTSIVSNSSNNANAKKSSQNSFKLPKISLPTPEDILKSQKLVSIQRLEKLKKDYASFQKYIKRQNINKYKEQISKIQ